MEKISKEELFEKLKLEGMSPEDLEKIAGGDRKWEEYLVCFNDCMKKSHSTGEFCRENCKRLVED